MRGLVAVLAAVVLAGAPACSRPAQAGPYGALSARIGESLAVLGWNMAVSGLRWETGYLLVDVDATPSDPGAPHAAPADIRFGLYGALAHPVEATGVSSCDGVAGVASRPLAVPAPDRLVGTVCLGPLNDRAAVRGVYAYSPRDRIAGSTTAYAAAFPVGLAPVTAEDTGLALTTTSVTAWRADGTPLTPVSLGDPVAFTGDGYMLLNLVVDAAASRYRADAAARGGPMMLVAAPAGTGADLSPACVTPGSSVLVLPEASLGAVHLPVTLCTHGEVNAAVLYATVSVIGTHAAVWTVP